MGQSRANKFSQSSLETAVARDDDQKQIRWWQILNAARDKVNVICEGVEPDLAEIKADIDDIKQSVAEDDSSNGIVEWYHVLGENSDNIRTNTSHSDDLIKGVIKSASHIFENVANNGTVYALIRTGADVAPNAMFEFSVEGDVKFYLYEGATIAAVGTEITLRNQNRNFADGITNVNVYHTPTITTNGTQIGCAFLPGGTKNDTGTFSELNDDWILAPNTDYLIELDNTSGGAIDIGFNVVMGET